MLPFMGNYLSKFAIKVQGAESDNKIHNYCTLEDEFDPELQRRKRARSNEQMQESDTATTRVQDSSVCKSPQRKRGSFADAAISPELMVAEESGTHPPLLKCSETRNAAATGSFFFHTPALAPASAPAATATSVPAPPKRKRRLSIIACSSSESKQKPREERAVAKYVLNWFLVDTDEQDTDFQVFLLVDFIAALTKVMRARMDDSSDSMYGKYLSLRSFENETNAIRSVITTASMTLFPHINNPDVTYHEADVQKRIRSIDTDRYERYLCAEIGKGDFYGVQEYMWGVSEILRKLHATRSQKNEIVDPIYAAVFVHVVTQLSRVCFMRDRRSWMM